MVWLFQVIIPGLRRSMDRRREERRSGYDRRFRVATLYH